MKYFQEINLQQNAATSVLIGLFGSAPWLIIVASRSQHQLAVATAMHAAPPNK
jgi:hypothetical protein